MKKFLLMLSLSVCALGAKADSIVEKQIYADKQFAENRIRAIKLLEKKGFQVHEVEADELFGNPILEVDAEKDGLEYDIILSYPDLKIIRQKVDKD